MRINSETCLLGERCCLIPYREEHVLNYHRWMQDPQLLESTGSEPLSLDEEYEMQRTWRLDEAKCTFIILDKKKCVGIPPEKGLSSLDSNNNALLTFGLDDREEYRDINTLDTTSLDFVSRNLDAMVGDVNLFLSSRDEDHDCFPPNCDAGRSCKMAELDIMIAEKTERRKGLGAEASRLMMLYGISMLSIDRYFVKIGEQNFASLLMFEKVLHFRRCNYSECFREVELEFLCTKEIVASLRQSIGMILSFTSAAPLSVEQMK